MMTHPAERLLEKVSSHGWQGRIIPIERLGDLKGAILDRHARGLLDETFYEEALRLFSFERPADLAEACSIIVLAVPVPQVRLFFARNGKRLAAIVPPTYVRYTARTTDVRADLASWLALEGYRVANSSLPLKTLAVGSGLAQYGRNNITYVTGMGSFLQLVSAFSDLPCLDDPWREPQALSRCDSCVACRKHCPSGAIPQDRFLLRAELCLTFHNERAGDFPGWIDPSWHNCLIGCMRCQDVCPENKTVISHFDDMAEFSEKETELLLERVPFDRLPSETADKLRGLEINEEYPRLCRNLSMLVGEGNPVL